MATVLRRTKAHPLEIVAFFTTAWPEVVKTVHVENPSHINPVSQSQVFKTILTEVSVSPFKVNLFIILYTVVQWISSCTPVMLLKKSQIMLICKLIVSYKQLLW